MTGPTESPRVNGTLTFSNSSLNSSSIARGMANGAMYLSADDPSNPVLSMHVTSMRSDVLPSESPETWLYGARSSGMTLTWNASAASDDQFMDAPNEMAAFTSPPITAKLPLFLSFR